MDTNVKIVVISKFLDRGMSYPYHVARICHTITDRMNPTPMLVVASISDCVFVCILQLLL
jgi:hypothetical protein